MKTPLVKICGLTREADAQLAVALGAQAIGLVFARESLRKISVMHAQKIISCLPSFVCSIGVFTSASAPETEILDTIKVAGLKGVQVEWDLSPEFYAELKRRDLRVFRTVTVRDDLHMPKIGNFDEVVFDSPRDTTLRQTLNLKTLQRLSPSRPFYIAGGLNAENIGVYVKALRPYGVDVSSGLESRPGIKSDRALRDFFRALREGGGTQ